MSIALVSVVSVDAVLERSTSSFPTGHLAEYG